MAEMTTGKAETRVALRPALVIDAPTLERFSDTLRRVLVCLACESHPPALICPPDAGAEEVLSPAVRQFDYPFFRLPVFYKQNRELLLDKLITYKPSILHCFSQNRARITRFLAEAMDIPYVVTFNAFRGRALKPTISPTHCSNLIASNRAIAGRLRKAYPTFAGSIVQINLGTFVEETVACFAEEGRLVSMMVAQPLEDRPFFEALLNAVRHLAIDGYEFVLAIVGKGSAARHIHELISRLGISQIVTMVGDIHPLRDFFSGADVFIHCRQSTDVNYPLMEAMSVGMVVAAGDDSNEDFLIADETAAFFDPGDEFSIYKGLQKLLDDRDYARTLARSGQNYFRQHHTVSRMSEQLIGLYRNAQKSFRGLE